MKTSVLAITGLLTLSSCGLFQWWDVKNAAKERATASMSVQHLLADDELSFHEEVQQKLTFLHHYYVFAQKHLLDFDGAISDIYQKDLYQSDEYLTLLAIRTQIDEIEHELVEVWSAQQKSRMALKHKLILQNLISKFASGSKMRAASMENLMTSLGIQDLSKVAAPSSADIHKEFKLLENEKEFQLLEKNIEHLAHVMDTKTDDGVPAFVPSSEKQGHFSGNEFPKNVWAVTFDDGPSKTSASILKTLQDKKIPATFFQLTSKAQHMPEEIALFKKSGMQIAAHSWNHLQLSKVGGTTLTKEVTLATKELEKIHSKKVSFYRLPYGAGAGHTHVRQKIAEAGLIHVSWNVDSLDWIPQSPDKIVARTLQLMGKISKDSGIILLHDVHERSAMALPKILEHLKRGDRRTCSLEQIVSDMNEGSPVVCVKN